MPRKMELPGEAPSLAAHHPAAPTLISSPRRFTVPVLYDKKGGVIVNNESSEILRIFNSQFNDLVRRRSLMVTDPAGQFAALTASCPRAPRRGTQGSTYTRSPSGRPSMMSTSGFTSALFLPSPTADPTARCHQRPATAHHARPHRSGINNGVYKCGFARA